ncbi:hypothetical protein K504DRAFT_94328 [Pleomassaria siparia CBS 279.74]|uniref:Uncharacterized protein n=1 Tax=Pleomassaria siparia CBS 279.74 TaxID=1314801 RepID=A0A6G1JZ79_9PLEO|nr:hypothetical protein K504DRAFT_94328 [Pleomassaria siparia CBS 279.74]
MSSPHYHIHHLTTYPGCQIYIHISTTTITTPTTCHFPTSQPYHKKRQSLSKKGSTVFVCACHVQSSLPCRHPKSPRAGSRTSKENKERKKRRAVLVTQSAHPSRATPFVFSKEKRIGNPLLHKQVQSSRQKCLLPKARKSAVKEKELASKS